MAFWGQKAVAIPFAHDACHKCLLLYPRLGGQHSGYIVQIPHFISLICGKRHNRGGDKGLHLHIGCGHQSAGDIPQVDGLIPLVHVEYRGLDIYFSSDPNEPCLRHERDLQGAGQGLFPLMGPAQDTQAGFRG